MIKAIIFDVDQTLIDSFNHVLEAIQLTGREYYQMEITEDDVRIHWGKPMKDACLGYYSHVDSYENIHANLIKTVNKMERQMQAFPGVIDLVESLKSQYFLGILTSAHSQAATKLMLQAGYNLESFNFIIGEESSEVHKPNPVVFSPVIELLGAKDINPEQTLYIGDSVNDWLATRDAGMKFIAVTTGMHTKSEFRDEGMEERYILESLNELTNLIITI